ncbi:hypothetical protein Avbf_02538 [Armadillidium vulgare]|nr:hypothetical protein Avbf_02538 [Armadillidium vulgare]
MSRWGIKTADILFEQLVAVYSEEEDTFYRGTIITISGVDNVQFLDLPAQAINAKLHNVELRNGVEKTSCKFLELVTSSEPLTAKVYDVDVKNYSLTIEIFGDDGTSINEILVNEGYCRYRSSPKLVSKGKKLTDKFGEKKCSSPSSIDSDGISSSIGKLSLIETELVGENRPDQENFACNYSKFQPYSPVSAHRTDDKLISLKENEESDAQLNNEIGSLNFNYDKFSDYSRQSASQTSELETCLKKLTSVDDQDLKVCSFTNSFKNSATPDTGFLSSSDENILLTTEPNSSQNDLLFKALMSLESARMFIKLKRRQIFSQLSQDSSFNSIYVNLSTIKANIVTLETGM